MPLHTLIVRHLFMVEPPGPGQLQRCWHTNARTQVFVLTHICANHSRTQTWNACMVRAHFLCAWVCIMHASPDSHWRQVSESITHSTSQSVSYSIDLLKHLWVLHAAENMGNPGAWDQFESASTLRWHWWWWTRISSIFQQIRQFMKWLASQCWPARFGARIRYSHLPNASFLCRNWQLREQTWDKRCANASPM